MIRPPSSSQISLKCERERNGDVRKKLSEVITQVQGQVRRSGVKVDSAIR